LVVVWREAGPDNLLQIAVLLGFAQTWLNWRVAVQKKDRELCALLAERLRMDWSARELSSLCMGSIRNSARWRWRQIRCAHGLRAMFANTGLMLKMVGHAARGNAPVDANLLKEFRRDAKTVRLGIVKMVAEFFFHVAEEKVAAEALRAEQAYAEMEMCLSVLLASCTTGPQPHFVHVL
jgi:hypothetical protein